MASVSATLKDTQCNVVEGIGTFNYQAVVAGVYSLVIQSTVFSPSTLQVEVTLNGDVIGTSAALTSTQSHLNLELTDIQIDATDEFIIRLTSGSTVPLNSVKTLIDIIIETSESD